MPDILTRQTRDELFGELETAFPAFAKLREQDRAKQDRQRAAAAAERDRIESDFLPKLEAAAVAKKAAEAKAEKLRRDHQLAVGAAIDASRQCFALGATKTRLVGAQERILRSTADARIQKLHREISDALSEPYGGVTAGSIEPSIPPVFDAIQGRTAHAAAVAAAQQAQREYDAKVTLANARRAALRELADLELEAVDGAELAKRLASIRSRALGTNGYHSIKL